ncbi:HD domain-containing protein [Larkinella rosea]|nr:HD domain-containing protein [Larkinella rosea]
MQKQKETPFSSLEKLVLAFATYAHRNQVRKYTNEPYINHCIAVAQMVKLYGGTEEMVCAALLHDTVEDTEISVDNLMSFFSSLRIPEKSAMQIGQFVEWLTDQFTKDAYPELNRRQRKEQELLRLSKSSSAVQTIKYCDMINNASTIGNYSPEFAKVYLQENLDLLAVMDKGDPELRKIALDLAAQES